MRPSVVAVTCAAMLVAISFANRAMAGNLVLNGGFEEIQPFPQPFVDWTVIEGFTQYLFPVPVPHTGEWGAGFAATHHADDTLLQSIPTAPGNLYQLDFWLYSISSEPDPPDNDFTVLWNNVPVLALLNAPAFPFTHYTYSVLATEAETELRFTGANWHAGFVLDDVSVVLIPEPPTFALAALGMLAPAALARRRARNPVRPPRSEDCSARSCVVRLWAL